MFLLILKWSDYEIGSLTHLQLGNLQLREVNNLLKTTQSAKAHFPLWLLQQRRVVLKTMLLIANKLLTYTHHKNYFEVFNIPLGSKYRIWEKIWAKCGLPGHHELLALLPLQM